MRNFMVENGHVIAMALIKFEHPDWGVRYKTLVLNEQCTEDEIVEYANKERVNGESFEITLKIANLKNNIVFDIKEID